MKFFSFLAAALLAVAPCFSATITLTSDSINFDGIHGIADASETLLGAGVGAGLIGRMTIEDSVVTGYVQSGDLAALNDAFQLFGNEGDAFALNSRGPNGAFDASIIFDTRVSVNQIGGKPIWLWLFKGGSRTTATEFFLVKLTATFPTDAESGNPGLPFEVFARPTTIAGLFSGLIGPDTHDYYGPPDGVAVAKFKMQAVGSGTGNQPPVAVAGSLEAFAGIPKTGQLLGTDPEEDALIFSVVASPAKGSVVVDANGSFTYTADVGQLGSDSFTFKVNDGVFDSAPATISITITEAPPNSAPVAASASFQMVSNDLLIQQLTASDADSDALSFAKASEPSHGSVQVRADGAFSYLPANGFVGEDSFTFTAFDGIETSAPALVVIVVRSQTPNWTWMNGSSAVNQNGVYGDQAVADPANTPGARSLTASVSKGNIAYVFGGVGRGAAGGNGLLNDLWKFDSTTNEWTWLSGGNTVNQPGVYGTPGQSSPTNQPGGRSGALMWIADDGQLWLFGGAGRASTTATGELNDLWSFDPDLGEWIWQAGDNGVNANGVYGVRGVPSAETVPGGRTEAVGWLDGTGHFWVFGGRGRGATGSVVGLLNDLWKLNLASLQWTHVHGGSGINSNGVSNDRTSTTNLPGGRSGAVGWIDPDGALWLYGGRGLAASGKVGNLGDLWVFRPSLGAWSSKNGSDKTNVAPVYGALGEEMFGATPGARFGTAGWLGADGNLYLFGGSGRGTYSDVWRFNRQTEAWSWIKGHDKANQVGIYGEKEVSSPSNSPGSRAGSIAFVTPASQLWLFSGAAGARSFSDVWRMELPQGPSVELKAPAVALETAVDLELVVVSNSVESETTVTVEYATASFPTQRTAVDLAPVAPGLPAQPISTTLAGLTAGTDYEVRVVVANAGGTTFSQLRRFKTSGDAAALSLVFTEASSLADEGQGLHTVEVALSGPVLVAFDVPLTITGTAGASDFQLLTPSVRFIAGQVRALIDLRLIDNTVAAADKTLTLTLGAPSDSGIGLGAPSSHVVTIRDDDAGPAVVVLPAPQLVAVGDTAEFSAVANGQGPFTYQWVKGTAKIARTNAASFQKTNVRLLDAGSYSVEISSARGKTTSPGAPLAVVDAAPTQLVVAEGGSASLSITTAGSGLSFAWRKLGNPAVLATTSAHTLNSLSLADSGDYQCTVSLAGAGDILGGVISISVVNAAPTLPLTSLPGGYVGSPYEFQVEVGNAPEGAAATLAISGLPPGLSASGSGLITGIPRSTVNSKTVLIRAINPVATTLQVATITVLGVPTALVGHYVAAIPSSASSEALRLGGRLDLTTTAAGSFSATLQLGTTKSRARGPLQVSPTGATGTAIFTRQNAPSIEVAFVLDPQAEAGEFDVTGTAHDGLASHSFEGVRLTIPSANRLGMHSFGLLLDDSLRGALTVPQGSGFGAATVTNRGRVALVGRTADGASYTSASGIGREGDIPVYFSAPILRTGNAIVGTVRQEVAGINGMEGDLLWSRAAALANAKTRSYRGGFDGVPVTLSGGLYAGPTPGSVIAGLPTGSNNVAITFENRALIEGALADLTFTIANAGGVRQRVTLPVMGSAGNPSRVSFKLGARPAGHFSGGFILDGATPALSRRAVYQGLFVRLPTGEYFGSGYFLLSQPPEPGQTVRTATELSGDVVVEAVDGM